MVELDDLLVRPGTYFNPQTEIVVVVDDSTSIDQEVFNMEAYEGADWVRISDEVPVAGLVPGRRPDIQPGTEADHRIDPGAQQYPVEGQAHDR